MDVGGFNMISLDTKTLRSAIGMRAGGFRWTLMEKKMVPPP